MKNAHMNFSFFDTVEVWVWSLNLRAMHDELTTEYDISILSEIVFVICSKVKKKHTKHTKMQI